jgi:hypothetical protein
MHDDNPAPIAPKDDSIHQNQSAADIRKPEDFKALQVGDEVLGLDGVERPNTNE